jgi:class 3 adenylate cyclase
MDAFERLGRLPELDAGLLRRIRAHFLEGEPAELYRINLVTWSARFEVALDVAVTHFLHLVHEGAADLSWDAHCPLCNVVVARAPTLADARPSHPCAYCLRDVEVRLDDHYEVTFTPNRSVREVAGSVRYLPSRNVHVLAREPIPAGASARLRITVPDQTRLLRIVAWPPETVHVVPVGEPTLTRPVRFIGGEHRQMPEAVPPGESWLEVSNESNAAVIALIENHDMGEHTPDEREPRLTGLDLVSVPAFRTLFGADTLPPEQSLAVRDVTIAFTDIRGSTELYKRVGEVTAYRLVREHFEVLFDAVHRHAGTIVKTIGDAVMASFRRPHEAVAALLDAQATLAAHNADPRRAAEIVVRGAIHRGPALAVTLNDRLDYFGTTVNETARMEGACEGGELVISDEVRAAPGVGALCERLDVEPFEARFRGLPDVYRCHRVRRSDAR